MEWKKNPSVTNWRARGPAFQRTSPSSPRGTRTHTMVFRRFRGQSSGPTSVSQLYMEKMIICGSYASPSQIIKTPTQYTLHIMFTYSCIFFTIFIVYKSSNHMLSLFPLRPEYLQLMLMIQKTRRFSMSTADAQIPLVSELTQPLNGRRCHFSKTSEI